jgi:hypothetical protein
MTQRQITFADVSGTGIAVSDLAGNGGGDDSSAINAAIDAALDKRAAGIPSNVIFDAKVYKYKTPHAILTKPVGFIGRGRNLTRIIIDPLLNGDIFSWSDVWGVNPQPDLSQSGVILSGLTILGNRTSLNQQNVFNFYDRTDDLFINDVNCWYVPGRALVTGLLNLKTQAYLRESHIIGFKSFRCGLAGIPSVEFATGGTGDATNTNKIHNLDIFAPYGPGLVIRNQNNVKNICYMDFFATRIEGMLLPSPAITDDLLVLGDTGSAYIGGISQLNFFGLVLINPYAGQAAFTIQAKNSTVGNLIYEINAQGVNIGPSVSGNGINIQAGRFLDLGIFDNSVSGTQLIVGASSLGIAAPIRINGHGYENGWSKSVDATSAQFLDFSLRHNLAATAVPAITDDTTKLYSPGSLWMVVGTGEIWRCRSATTNAAVWVKQAVSDFPGYIANNWYVPIGPDLSSTGVNPGIGSIRLYLGLIPEKVTIKTIGVRVNTLSVSGNVQCAIYANNPVTNAPTGNALVSTTSLSTTTAVNVNAAAAVTLEPGMYWFATNMDNATAILASVSASSLNDLSKRGVAAATGLGGSGSQSIGYSVAQAFGTWPDLTSGGFANITSSSLPIVQFQVNTAP